MFSLIPTVSQFLSTTAHHHEPWLWKWYLSLSIPASVSSLPGLKEQWWKIVGEWEGRTKVVSFRGTENEKDSGRKQVTMWKRQFKLSLILLALICHRSAPLSLSTARAPHNQQFIFSQCSGTEKEGWWDTRAKYSSQRQTKNKKKSYMQQRQHEQLITKRRANNREYWLIPLRLQWVMVKCWYVAVGSAVSVF